MGRTRKIVRVGGIDRLIITIIAGACCFRRACFYCGDFLNYGVSTSRC